MHDACDLTLEASRNQPRTKGRRTWKTDRTTSRLSEIRQLTTAHRRHRRPAPRSKQALRRQPVRNPVVLLSQRSPKGIGFLGIT